jgi:hypothetical protein
MRYLSRGWRHIANYPILLALPLTITAITSLLGIGVAGVAMGWAMAGQVGRGGGTLLLLALVAAALAPAIASGFNAMVGAAARHQPVTIRVFTTNLGRYYWRIMGGALLTGLVLALLGLLLGQRGAYSGGFSLASVISLLLGYFSHLWFAAVVVDDAGAIAAVGLAFAQVTRRLFDYGPLLGLGVLVGVLVPEILGVGRVEQVIGARSMLHSLIMGFTLVVLRIATVVAYEDGRRTGSVGGQIDTWPGEQA